MNPIAPFAPPYYGPISAFYDAEMRDWAAAEHSLHVLLAAPGAKRLVFPTRSHMKMFFGVEEVIAAQVVEVAAQVVGSASH